LKSDFFDSFNGLSYWRWAGVNSACKQKKLEARKMLVNGDESHLLARALLGADL
jgi:hypothetical protein